jgi:cell wall-associated NlpC family hydrolase
MMLHAHIVYQQEIMKNFQRATLACSASVIAALCLIAPASASSAPAEVNKKIEQVSSVTEKLDLSLTISAPATAKVTFEEPVIKSIAAPKPKPVVKKVVAPVAAPAVAVQTSPEVAVATEARTAPVAVAAPVAAVQAQAPVAAPAAKVAAPVAVAPKAPPVAAPVASSAKGAAIAAAAYAQLGVAQDCTMLVTNSLKAVGINFHDWPAGYKSLGTIVPASQAKAGDIIYYDNAGAGVPHVAVYVGGGQAVHGGWNGGTTALFSANLGSGPVFIRVA